MRTESDALAFIEGYGSRELTPANKAFLAARCEKWTQQGFHHAVNVVRVLTQDDPFAPDDEEIRAAQRRKEVVG